MKVWGEATPPLLPHSTACLRTLPQGMAALADEHQARIDEQVAKFEAHVMQTSLHVPAGLLASAPPAPAPGSQVRLAAFCAWWGGRAPDSAWVEEVGKC